VAQVALFSIARFDARWAYDVVSPLISLMKDQVDALQTSGIPGNVFEFQLERQEAIARWRGLHRGDYRMLYVAPERLMLETFLERRFTGTLPRSRSMKHIAAAWVMISDPNI